MGLELLLAVLLAITIRLAFSIVRAHPTTLEEINHLASIENLKVLLCSTNPQPFDHSKYFLVYGGLFFCKYYFEKGAREFDGTIYFSETIEAAVIGEKGWIIATFKNGHLASWRFSYEKTLQEMEPMREHLHERWLLQHLLSTVENAVSVMNGAVD